MNLFHPSGAILRRKFERQFKRRDESKVNPRACRARGEAGKSLYFRAKLPVRKAGL